MDWIRLVSPVTLKFLQLSFIHHLSSSQGLYSTQSRYYTLRWTLSAGDVIVFIFFWFTCTHPSSAAHFCLCDSSSVYHSIDDVVRFLNEVSIVYDMCRCSWSRKGSKPLVINCCLWDKTICLYTSFPEPKRLIVCTWVKLIICIACSTPSGSKPLLNFICNWKRCRSLSTFQGVYFDLVP